MIIHNFKFKGNQVYWTAYLLVYQLSKTSEFSGYTH